jgi:hypothetical protein
MQLHAVDHSVWSTDSLKSQKPKRGPFSMPEMLNKVIISCPGPEVVTVGCRA